MAWGLLGRNSQPSWAQPCLLEILQLVSYPKALIYFQKGWSKMAKQRSKALCQRQLSSNSSMDSLSSTRTPFHYIHENSQVASIHTGSQIVMPYLSQGKSNSLSALDCDVVPWFFEVRGTVACKHVYVTQSMDACLKGSSSFCLHHFKKKNDFSTQFSTVPYDRLALCLGLFAHTAYLCNSICSTRYKKLGPWMPSGKSYLLSLPQLPWALFLLFHSDMASPSTPFRLRSLKNSLPVALLSCHQQQKVLFLEAFFMHYHFTRVFTFGVVCGNLELFNPKKENEAILASCVLLKPWPLSIPCPTWRRSADSCTFCLRIKRPLSQRLLPILPKFRSHACLPNKKTREFTSVTWFGGVALDTSRLNITICGSPCLHTASAQWSSWRSELQTNSVISYDTSTGQSLNYVH